MLKPRHDIIGTPSSGMTPRRMMIVGTVGLLHVLAIYALITGMATTVLKHFDPDIVMTKVEPSPPPKPIPTPPKPVIVQPTTAIPTAPVAPHVDIQTPVPDNPVDTITVGTKTPDQPLPVDSGPAGLMNTHTTPPYPPLARSQSHQGTVHLAMTISALGDVTAANVLESSGFPDLDEAAVAWVIAHWKYKPALQAGVAMAGQTQAAVRFDLKQARN